MRSKAGGQLGMNEEADQIRKILLKGNAATEPEKATLGKLLTKMAEKNNANLAAALKSENHGAVNIAETIAADIAKAMPEMNKVIIEKNNPNNKKDLGAEADKRKVSEREQYIINNVDRIARLLGDRIVKNIGVILGSNGGINRDINRPDLLNAHVENGPFRAILGDGYADAIPFFYP